VAEVVAERPHLAGAAAEARRAMGVNCAVGVGQLHGRESYAETEKSVLRIHDCARIRMILWLHRIRLTPALQFSRSVKAFLRHHVKQILYQG
jgi:hypothetical protein